jgi:hypothetical protein
VDAHISYLLFLGLWLLLAGVVALGARWLGGAPQGVAAADAEAPRLPRHPGSPLTAWAGTAVALTGLWLLWAHRDPDSISAVILLAVLAILLLHVARRGVLADRDSP